MPEYSATISVNIGFEAQTDDQAQERAAEIADRLIVQQTLGKKPYPDWYDSEALSHSVEDVTCESD